MIDRVTERVSWLVEAVCEKPSRAAVRRRLRPPYAGDARAGVENSLLEVPTLAAIEVKEAEGCSPELAADAGFRDSGEERSLTDQQSLRQQARCSGLPEATAAMFLLLGRQPSDVGRRASRR